MPYSGQSAVADLSGVPTSLEPTRVQLGSFLIQHVGTGPYLRLMGPHGLEFTHFRVLEVTWCGLGAHVCSVVHVTQCNVHIYD